MGFNWAGNGEFKNLNPGICYIEVCYVQIQLYNVFEVIIYTSICPHKFVWEGS